jgi:hypothetical protein
MAVNRASLPFREASRGSLPSVVSSASFFDTHGERQPISSSLAIADRLLPAHCTSSHEEDRMREQVTELLSLGPLPDSDKANEEDIDRRAALLEAIALPVSDEEARSLVSLFGSDDAFGLAFSVRRLVESAPGWPIWDVIQGEGPWMEDLRARAINSGYVP